MLPFKVTQDHVWVKTPYDQKDVVRQELNGVWSKKHGMYKFPKNIHAMRELMRHFPQLKLDMNYIEEGKRMVGARDRALRLKSATDVQGDERLRPYQRVDVNYLKHLPAALIANEPRTGKTPTSIMLMKELSMSYDMKKFLVIAPASLVLNWGKEFETWYPDCEVMVYQSGKKMAQSPIGFSGRSDGPNVVIVSKDTLKNKITLFDDYLWDACFVDEAHFLRNRDTAQSKAIFSLEAKRRYALTGTPTVKHAIDIFGILRFLYPTRFTSYWQFAERYFEMSEDMWGHKQIGSIKENRKSELQEMLGFMGVQRKRLEVMSWLPEKQYISHYCGMEPKQEKLYKQMLDDFVVFLDEEVVHDASNVLTQLMRLRQLCLDPRLLGFDVRGTKTNAILEWLDNNREPVIIMSMFTSYLQLLKPEIEKLGLKVGEINGQMSSTDKEQAKVAFQEGRLDVLLCNIISAGVGFTLDRAKVICFTDKAWNPSENEQAEDRITPTTKEKNHAHEILSFVVAGTVDERIDHILKEKKSITDLINEGGREAIKRLL